MIRKYNLYVNGTKITDGDNRIIVNGANVRRCLVNGVDIIKNFAQLKMQLKFNASVIAFSDFYNSCGAPSDESGFNGWYISNLTLSSSLNDFTLLSADFRLSISNARNPYEDYYDAPSYNFTSFPLTINNVKDNQEAVVGGAVNGLHWYLYAKFNSLSIRYEATGEVFNLSNKAFILQEGSTNEYDTNTWSQELTFNVSKELLVEEAVKQY